MVLGNLESMLRFCIFRLIHVAHSRTIVFACATAIAVSAAGAQHLCYVGCLTNDGTDPYSISAIYLDNDVAVVPLCQARASSVMQIPIKSSKEYVSAKWIRINSRRGIACLAASDSAPAIAAVEMKRPEQAPSFVIGDVVQTYHFNEAEGWPRGWFDVVVASRTQSSVRGELFALNTRSDAHYVAPEWIVRTGAGGQYGMLISPYTRSARKSGALATFLPATLGPDDGGVWVAWDEWRSLQAKKGTDVLCRAVERSWSDKGVTTEDIAKYAKVCQDSGERQIEPDIVALLANMYDGLPLEGKRMLEDLLLHATLWADSSDVAVTSKECAPVAAVLWRTGIETSPLFGVEMDAWKTRGQDYVWEEPYASAVSLYTSKTRDISKIASALDAAEKVNSAESVIDRLRYQLAVDSGIRPAIVAAAQELAVKDCSVEIGSQCIRAFLSGDSRDKAIALARKQADRYPDRWVVETDLAMALYLDKQVEECTKVTRHIADHYTKSRQAQGAAAALFEKLELPQEALTHYLAAARLGQDKGDWADALRLAKRLGDGVAEKEANEALKAKDGDK